MSPKANKIYYIACITHIVGEKLRNWTCKDLIILESTQLCHLVEFFHLLEYLNVSKSGWNVFKFLYFKFPENLTKFPFTKLQKLWLSCIWLNVLWIHFCHPRIGLGSYKKTYFLLDFIQNLAKKYDGCRLKINLDTPFF